MLQTAFAALQAGDASAAEQIARTLLSADPNHEGGLLLLAFCLDAQSRPFEAAELFERLVAVFPQTAEHWTNLGNCRAALGDADRARIAYARAITLDPQNAESLRGLGVMLMDRGIFQSAKDQFLKALEVAPEDAVIRSLAARACYEAGDGEKAETLLTGWQNWAATDAHSLAEIAWTFAQVGNIATAELALDAAEHAQPAHPRVQVRRVAYYERTNRVAEANALLARVDLTAAASEGLSEDIAVVRALLAARGVSTTDACRSHEQLLSSPQTRQRHPHLYFSLARLYDRAGDVDSAMTWLAEGHGVQLAQLQVQSPGLLDADADPMEITQRRVGAMDHQQWQAVTAPTAEASPIFILGFPRSGTTMLETMLDAHPDLACMDERSFLQDVVQEIRDLGLRYPEDLGQLDTAVCERLRAVYWQQVRTRTHVDGSKQLVDKNPLNMLRLPLIARLFPQAKIVLALRHPCDVVLSNYMQMFRAPVYAAMCATLTSTAQGYAKAFDFWIDQAQILRPDVLQLRHEDTVDDIEQHARAICNFLNIAWDPCIVAFDEHARSRGYIATPSYHQVVEPLNRRGIGRWEKYRTWLEPALPILHPFIQRWNYTT